MIDPALRPARARRLLLAAPVLVLALAACGSGSSGAGSGAGSATAAPASSAVGANGSGGGGANGGGGNGGRRQPGVVGQTVELAGDTLQVRTAEGQTAVQFSATTRITEQRAATAAAVTVGACVVAVGSPDAGGTGVAAQTVTVSAATSGQSCAADAGRGFGGGGGGFGGGARGTRTGQPGGGPGAGQPGGQPGGNGGAPTTPIATAFGTVTAVTPTSVTLTGGLRTFARQAAGSSGARPTGSTSESPTLSPVTVTLTATTRVNSTVVVPSSALAVGQCVTAQGPSNDIGTVTAGAISIRPAAADGTCTTGFGGFGGRRGGASGSAQPSGTTNG